MGSCGCNANTATAVLACDAVPFERVRPSLLMHHDPRRQAQDKSDMAMLFQRQLTTKEREWRRKEK